MNQNFWDKNTEEAFASDFSDFLGYIDHGIGPLKVKFSQYKYYLPSSIVTKLEKIERYFDKLDLSYITVAPSVRVRKNRLCHLDFIVSYFLSLERKAFSGCEVVLGTGYKSPIPWAVFNPKISRISKNEFYHFYDLFSHYASDLTGKCESLIMRFDVINNPSRSGLDILASKYHTTHCRALCIAICLAYDICTYAGPDCDDAVEFFINALKPFVPKYDASFLKNVWESAWDSVFLRQDELVEKNKLINICGHTKLYPTVERLDRTKFKISSIDVSKLNSSSLESSDMILLIKDIKNDKNDDDCCNAYGCD